MLSKMEAKILAFFTLFESFLTSFREILLGGIVFHLSIKLQKTRIKIILTSNNSQYVKIVSCRIFTENPFISDNARYWPTAQFLIVHTLPPRWQQLARQLGNLIERLFVQQTQQNKHNNNGTNFDGNKPAISLIRHCHIQIELLASNFGMGFAFIGISLFSIHFPNVHVTHIAKHCSLASLFSDIYQTNNKQN